jgi:acetyltransferase-like isoleucine patch superfamily enzyme
MGKIISVFRRLRGITKFGVNNYSYSYKNCPSIKGKMYINKIGKLNIGKNLAIVSLPWSTQLTVEEGASLTIGDNVFINAGCGIAATKEISIGNNVKIGPRTSILDSDYHLLDEDIDKDHLRRPIIIEDNVWIGTRCTILPGVRIGRNSVIATGSVVNKDIPSNVLAGGTPAKVIKVLSVSDSWIRT